MNSQIAGISSSLKLIALALTMAFSASAFAKDQLPETVDGLQLQKGTKLAVVYLQAGETLEDYDKIKIDDVYVAFKKNWQRDYNKSTVTLGEKVRDRDVEKIKEYLANEFKAVLTKELQDKSDYEVVETTGKDVLLIQPAIINLVVTAPDVHSAARNRSRISSAGQMTLYMELYDSKSGDKIALVSDAQAVGERGSFGYRATSGTNKMEFGRVLAKWADTLRNGLDEAKAAASPSGD
jgi:hypothetical protein